MIDLRAFVAAAHDLIRTHALGPPGAYARWPGEDAPNPYGCADAANILYTLDAMPPDREGWIATLQGQQDPATGLFHEATHHPIHTTAHCLAALELFDARPLHKLRELAPWQTPDGVRIFLAGLDWAGHPWNESHRGAGLYAATVLARTVDPAWEDAYFAWLWDWTDPATGLIGGPHIAPVHHAGSGTTSLVPHMAGTFHYLFNMQWARRPMRYPAALVDTCLTMLDDPSYPLGRTVGFAEIDWLYCTNRGVRGSGHRFAEAQDAMVRLGKRLVDFLQSLDPAIDPGLNDLHRLFGVMCALAELQQAVPGLVRTERPLRLVLDRRPFI